jgi:GTPase-activating protein BEM2
MVGHNPSGVSISISAPEVHESVSQGPAQLQSQQQQQQGQNFHIRSHSFTPRLPSKLSNPKFRPPTPTRKGSAPLTPLAPGEADPWNNNPPAGPTSRSNTSPTPTAAPRVPFPFNPTAPAPKPPSPQREPPQPAKPEGGVMRNNALMPPPTIVEPTGNESKSSKRASQYVHQSGFINRLTDYQHNHHHRGELSKGWKAFKMEAKGSKLFFYKPPGDRSAGVRDLFVTGLVAEDGADDAESETDADESANAAPTAATALAMGNRKRRAFWGRGTHPALVCDPRTGTIESGPLEALTHEAVFRTTFTPEKGEEWKRFAGAILLGLPGVVGREVFEAELVRCCAYFVQGAGQGKRDEPVEEGTAENFDARERVAWLATEYLNLHGSPVDQATWDRWKEETIPDVELPLYSPPASVSTTRPSQSTIVPGASPWGDVLDPNVVARSLAIFHRSVMAELPRHLTVELVLGSRSSTSTSCAWPLKALLGSPAEPHWLTRFILLQLLGPSSSSPSRSRAELISTWAKVGERCRRAGDEMSWRSICEALCCKPVARLEGAWRGADRAGAGTVVRGWLKDEGNGDGRRRATLWCGDAGERIGREVKRAMEGGNEVWLVGPLVAAREAFEDIRSAVGRWKQAEDGGGDGEAGEEGETPEVRKMVEFWREVASVDGGGGAKFVRYDHQRSWHGL